MKNQELIYRGIKIEKLRRGFYMFRTTRMHFASRVSFARLIIDKFYKECEKKNKLVSVCEFGLKTNAVFDWKQVPMKLLPEIANHTSNSFLIIEEERSYDCYKLINEYVSKGGFYLQ